MGLAKSIQSASGVNSTYFKIVRLFINNDENRIEVTLAGYLSQELADEGKDSLEERVFSISDPTLYSALMAGANGIVKEIENAILASNPAIDSSILADFSSASQVQDMAPSA